MQEILLFILAWLETVKCTGAFHQENPGSVKSPLSYDSRLAATEIVLLSFLYSLCVQLYISLLSFPVAPLFLLEKQTECLAVVLGCSINHLSLWQSLHIVLERDEKICCARNNKKFWTGKKYVFVHVGVSAAGFTSTYKICPVDIMICIQKVLFQIWVTDLPWDFLGYSVQIQPLPFAYWTYNFVVHSIPLNILLPNI